MATSFGFTARQVFSKSKSAAAEDFICSSVRVPGLLGRRLRVDDHDRVECGTGSANGIHVPVFADEHSRTGIGEDVVDGFGCRRVVDGEGCRAEVLGADVDRVELDAVTHHQCNRIALSHADSGQSRGNLADLFGVLAPRQCSRIADVSQGPPRRALPPILAGRLHTTWS